MGVLVHGVVEATPGQPLDLAALTAVAAGGVRTVAAGDVAALVTDVDGDEVLPSRANLLGHTRLLELAAAQVTVVPMRFGVVLPGDEQLVSAYLEPRSEELTATLVRLRDRAELRLSATYDEDEVIQIVLDADPRLGRLRGRDDVDSRMRLGEGVARSIEARRAGDGDTILAELAPHAEDLATSKVSGALDVVTASFLVSADATTAFERAVEQIGERFAPTVTMELIGPMPAFSFAQEG